MCDVAKKKIEGNRSDGKSIREDKNKKGCEVPGLEGRWLVVALACHVARQTKIWREKSRGDGGIEMVE